MSLLRALGNSMSIWGIILVLCILSAIAYRATMVYFRASAARQLMGDEHPYTKNTTDYAKTLLVLGDSTGVGVGADTAEETVAGRLSSYIGATHVENYAVSGATVADLGAQLEKATLSAYDTILIQIGGNDIIFFHDAKRTAQRLDIFMMTLPDAKQVILMTAGNVGGATIFPLIVRPFHTWTNKAFHKWFSKVAIRRHAVYVNLYEEPEFDLFLKYPERYLSSDGLHPSSEGYGLWFEKVKETLKEPRT